MRPIIAFVLFLLLYHNAECQDSNTSIIIEHISVLITSVYNENNNNVIRTYSDSKLYSGNYDLSLSFKIPLSSDFKLELKPGYFINNADNASTIHFGTFLRMSIGSSCYVRSGLDIGIIGFGEGSHGTSHSYQPQSDPKVKAFVSAGYNISKTIGLILSVGKQINEKYLKGSFFNSTGNLTTYTKYMQWAFNLGVEINFSSDK